MQKTPRTARSGRSAAQQRRLAAGLEHIDQGSTADWDAMIDTNVKGLLYVTRIITPKMIAAGGDT